MTMKEELKQLAKNRNYVIATISLSLSVLFVLVFSAVIGQLILPFGIEDTKFGAELGFNLNGFGIPGSIFFCLIIMQL